MVAAAAAAVMVVVVIGQKNRCKTNQMVRQPILKSPICYQRNT